MLAAVVFLGVAVLLEMNIMARYSRMKNRAYFDGEID